MNHAEKTTMTTTTITGTDAINYAAHTGAQLYKYADPLDGARGVTLDEAREIAREDVNIVWCEANAWTISDESRGDAVIHNLTPWRQRGEACADTVMRADPSAAGQLVTDDEAVGVLDHLGLWGDDQCDAELVAAGIAPTEEHRDAVRKAVHTGYVERMERGA